MEFAIALIEIIGAIANIITIIDFIESHTGRK